MQYTHVYWTYHEVFTISLAHLLKPVLLTPILLIAMHWFFVTISLMSCFIPLLTPLYFKFTMTIFTHAMQTNSLHVVVFVSVSIACYHSLRIQSGCARWRMMVLIHVLKLGLLQLFKFQLICWLCHNVIWNMTF